MEVVCLKSSTAMHSVLCQIGSCTRAVQSRKQAVAAMLRGEAQGHDHHVRLRPGHVSSSQLPPSTACL